MSYMNMQAGARPLRWWSPSQLDEAGGRIQAAWRRWLLNWAVSAEKHVPHVQCTLAWEFEPSISKTSWFPLGASGSARAWSREPEEPGTPVAAAVARQAHADLLEALRQALALEPCHGNSEAGPSADLFKPWSGAVVMSLRCEGADDQLLLLNGEAADKLLAAFDQAGAAPATQGPRSTIVSVEVALADKPITVRVALTPFELDLGALCSLRVGDVIPFPHSLDAPLTVSTGADALCTGFLGRQGAARAVELVREASAPTQTLHPKSR